MGLWAVHPGVLVGGNLVRTGGVLKGFVFKLQLCMITVSAFEWNATEDGLRVLVL